MALGPVNVIGDVTRTLESLLGALAPTLRSPADPELGGEGTAGGAINIYLYQVLESPHAKNRPWHTRPDGDREYPPLALQLYYLLTPYAGDQQTAHHVLGDAMRILHDNAIVPASALPASLRPGVEQIAIALMPLQLEELTRIWSALQRTYQLSVAYEVRVVLLESERVVTPGRVHVRIDHYTQR